MFLFVLSAATCLCFFCLFFFSIYTSLLVSHTSSRSRGTTTTTKKKYHDVKNAIVDIFVYLVLIYSCSFISLFEFLIYYNLAIYMNKAVRSVECYLLPSCVFVKMGQRLKKKKKELFFFFFLSFCFRSEFNRNYVKHQQVVSYLFLDEGEGTFGSSWEKKMIYQ